MEEDREGGGEDQWRRSWWGRMAMATTRTAGMIDGIEVGGGRTAMAAARMPVGEEASGGRRGRRGGSKAAAAWGG